jgi:hypothetical protein
MGESAPKPASVSWPVLVLSLLLAVAVTAAVMFALRPGVVPTANPAQDQPPAAHQPGVPLAEPITQKDTISPRDRPAGTVFYPIPFASPPNLKLTAAGRRVYETIKQDELGFTWAARLRLDDFPPEAPPNDIKALIEMSLGREKLSDFAIGIGGVGVFRPKPDLVFEDFTWDAKGIRGPALPPTLEQRGSFMVRPNTDGEVIFPMPYAEAAHVALRGNQWTIITECRANGFKWKNVVEKNFEFAAGGEVQYTAKGLRVVARQ